MLECSRQVTPGLSSSSPRHQRRSAPSCACGSKRAARRLRWLETRRSARPCNVSPRGRSVRCCSRGAAVHAAAWDEGLVDYVRLYVTPRVLGAGGVALLPGRSFSSADLRDRRIAPLGPDVLIEGYVHGSG